MSISEQQRAMDGDGPESSDTVLQTSVPEQSALDPSADLPVVVRSDDPVVTPRRPGYATQLAKARTAQSLTVDDLTRRTKIRPAIIEAIERDDIPAAGGIVYARGHLRSLATALGLDPVPLVASLDHTHRGELAQVPVLLADADAPEILVRPSRRSGLRSGARWPWVVAIVLVIVIAVTLVQLLVPGSSSDKQAVTPAAPSTAANKPPAAPVTAPTKPAATLPAMVFPVPAEGVTVRIVLPFLPSWMNVTDERGVALLAGVQPSSYKAIDLHAGAGMRVTVGDASAVAISCNGKPLPRPLGAPGQVMTLDLYRGNAFCPAA